MIVNLVLLGLAIEIGFGVAAVVRTSLTGEPTTWWLIPKKVGVQFYEA